MNEMFVSFEKLPMNDFSELTTSVCGWLEENFRTQMIKEIAQKNLNHIANGDTMQN